MVLGSFTTTTVAQTDIQALLSNACFVRIDDKAFLRISGSDATRWLNGMVTNSIESLQPSGGNYNFLLNAQGRILGDCNIFREPGEGGAVFILETSAEQIDTIYQLLDKFIIMDDVELTWGLRVNGSVASGLMLIGKTASDSLKKVNSESLARPISVPEEAGSMTYGMANGSEVIVFKAPQTGAPSYEIWLQDEQQRDLELDLLRRVGVKEIPPETLEAFRIFKGRPRYGVDIRDKDLPQETNQPQALHFAKGCYLGQEIVERIRSRGQVHRLFTAFFLKGDLPTLPAPLEAHGKPMGELTSATRNGDDILALGYARREALEAKATFTYPGGTAIPRTIEPHPASK